MKELRIITGVRVVAQRVKPTLKTPSLLTLSVPLPANAFWEAAINGSGTWILATPMGDVGGTLSSWLQPCQPWLA